MLVSSVWRARSRWWFSLGLLLGGLTSAVLAIAVGSLLLRPFLPTVVEGGVVWVVLAAVIAHESGLVRLPLPQNARQVPESIVADGPGYGALQFGFEMGTGVRTYMTSSLPHALAVSVLLLATWPEGILAGLAFGTGRAVMLLARHASRDDERWDHALQKYGRLLRLLCAAAAITTGATILLEILGR